MTPDPPVTPLSSRRGSHLTDVSTALLASILRGWHPPAPASPRLCPHTRQQPARIQTLSVGKGCPGKRDRSVLEPAQRCQRRRAAGCWWGRGWRSCWIRAGSGSKSLWHCLGRIEANLNSFSCFYLAWVQLKSLCVCLLLPGSAANCFSLFLPRSRYAGICPTSR